MRGVARSEVIGAATILGASRCSPARGQDRTLDVVKVVGRSGAAARGEIGG